MITNEGRLAGANTVIATRPPMNGRPPDPRPHPVHLILLAK